MAAGEIRDMVVYVKADYEGLEATVQIRQEMESADGKFHGVGGRTDSKTYKDLATMEAMTVSEMKDDVMAAAAAVRKG